MTETVAKFMADLDRQISDELMALQARGADRVAIEERHRELCSWAIVQCREEGDRRPADDSAEVITLRRLWDRVAVQVEASRAAGQIAHVSHYHLALDECGTGIALVADSDDDLDRYAGLAGEDWYMHFNPNIWASAMETLIDGLASYDVTDFHAMRVEDSKCGWVRMVYSAED